MPLEIPRRGARNIAFETAFQLLACEFRIETEEAEVSEALEFLVPHAAQEFPVSATYRYEVRLRGDRYEIAENGVVLDHERCPEYVMRRLYRRIKRLALQDVSGAIPVHGGAAVHQGTRFIVLGGNLAGKSTLMTRLLYDGVAVQGDHLTVLADGIATAFPRRFHLPEASLVHLPELRGIVGSLPHVTDEHGRRRFSFDPAAAGFDWRIDSGPAEAMFFLEPNHGGQTRLVPCPRVDMVQLAMAHSTPPARGDGRWIADLAAAVDRARTYLVYNGDSRRAALDILRHL